VLRPIGSAFGALAILAVVQVAGIAPARAQSEGAARCLVLGPLVVSSYVAFLEGVAGRERHTASNRAESTVALMDLHDRLGCPAPALTRAIECLSAALVAGETDRPVSAIAESCMRESGMPVR